MYGLLLPPFPSRWMISLVIFLSVFCQMMAAAPFWNGGVTTNALQAAKYADLPPFVFAPGGRLYSVEQTYRDSQGVTANLVVAIPCEEGMIVVSSSLGRSASPYLFTDAPRSNETDNWETLRLTDESTTTETFCELSKSSNLWTCFAGDPVHIQLARQQLLDLGTRWQGTAGPATIARAWADIRHRPTQVFDAESDMLACVAIVLDPNECWRVDPSGQFYRCHVAIVGQGAASAEATLLERVQTDLKLEDSATLTSSMVKRATKRWSRKKAEEIGLACVQSAMEAGHKVRSSETQSLPECNANVLIITETSVSRFETKVN